MFYFNDLLCSFIKIIDVGAFLHKGSYFRDPWNVIDTVVVCANIATLVLR